MSSSPGSRLANATCALFHVLLAVGLASVDYRELGLLTLPLILLAAIFLADLLSGIVHIWLDYYPVNTVAGFDHLLDYAGDRNSAEYQALRQAAWSHPTTSPIDRLAFNFKTHHQRPRAMNRKTYAEHMLETVTPAIGLVLATLALPAAIALTLLITAFLVANIQFVHACVHDTHRSVYLKRVIRALQRARIVYPLAVHTHHHRYGISNFCLITGWANIVLNPLFALLLKHGLVNRDNWTAFGAARPPVPDSTRGA